MALIRGDVEGRKDVLTRVHSVCLTGDVFGSLRCDCGTQLHEAMRRIADEGSGVIVYNTSHEGRGIGILDKIAAYDLQDQGLRDLGVVGVRLLTNNPDKLDQLSRYGIDITERVPLWVGTTPYNEAYLATKESRMGHIGHTEESHAG